jgi:cyclin-dependent kinase regulatory subunit CKS1
MLKAIPKDYFSDPSKYLLKLLWEKEWRGLGITQVRYCGQFMSFT